ncbi:MAG: thioredoxin family protein [Candidatus Cyclobacteriaceae bacterium M3_2C_046]
MNFRKLTLSLTLLLSISILASANNETDQKSTHKKNEINWLTIEEAQQLGKTNPRKVFVDVYTDWCVWCKRMDASTFSDQAVVNYVNDNYYAVKLDAESNNQVTFNGTTLTEQELARAFRVTGYPTIVLIDESFQRITPLPGYRKADEFKQILEQFDQEQNQ